MKKALFVFCAAVLLAAIGLQLVAAWRVEPERARTALGEAVPASLAGWAVTDLPIAETAEIQRAVGQLLNFDDALLRSYRRGGKQFDVYAAYWKPGKMSERLVAGHSPDVCWVAAGWTEESRGLPGDFATAAARTWLPPGGQYRVFKDRRNVRRWVGFWHVAGDRVIDYGQGVPPWWTVFSDFARRGFSQRSSQHFVRVSANVSWEELAGDESFQSVLRSVGALAGPAKTGR
jgi:hypothetical protein